MRIPADGGCDGSNKLNLWGRIMLWNFCCARQVYLCVADIMDISLRIVVFDCRRPKVLLLKDGFRIDLMVCGGQEKFGLSGWVTISFVEGYFCFQLAETTAAGQCQQHMSLAKLFYL